MAKKCFFSPLLSFTVTRSIYKSSILKAIAPNYLQWIVDCLSFVYESVKNAYKTILFNSLRYLLLRKFQWVLNLIAQFTPKHSLSFEAYAPCFAMIITAKEKLGIGKMGMHWITGWCLL